jgi:hypothetical protein
MGCTIYYAGTLSTIDEDEGVRYLDRPTLIRYTSLVLVNLRMAALLQLN